MNNDSLKASMLAGLLKDTDQLSQENKVHLYVGKGIKDSKRKIINDYLRSRLEADERITAIISANRVIPSINILALTDRRMLAITSFSGTNIDVVREVAADDISSVNIHGGVGFKKLWVIPRNGSSKFLCGIQADDFPKLQSLVSNMKGKPSPIAKKLLFKGVQGIQHDKDKAAMKAATKAEKKAAKAAAKQAKKYNKWAESPAGKEALKNKAIQQMRSTLQYDRALLTSVIAETIKKHWSTLEGKLHDFIEKDDYGNVLLHYGYKQELMYFSEKVVLPELQRRINANETHNKNVTLILQDTIYILQNIPADYFGIRYEDSDTTIAEKLLKNGGDQSTLDDEVLYTMGSDPEAMETYVENAAYIFMDDPLITLKFDDKLHASQPITVPPFAALVFVIFSAMHNNKSTSFINKNPQAKKVFNGNDPYKYEEFIKTLLREEGFMTRKTKSSGDYGVDVLASKDGKSYAIQCKLYNKPVGTKAVQEIVSGRHFYDADYAMVVSDNTFTNAAKILARKLNVTLTHHNELVRMIESIGGSDNIPNEGDMGATDSKPGNGPEAGAEATDKDNTDELITVILPTIRND